MVGIRMSILLDIAVSIVTSLAVWRFYRNWQFHQSTAGYRIARVIEATLLALDSQTNRPEVDATLASKYRNSLGPILLWLALTFDVSDDLSSTAMPRGPRFPNEPTWEAYDMHVRSVLMDINTNSFIGWLPGIPNVKRLIALQTLCFRIEELIGAADMSRNRQRASKTQDGASREYADADHPLSRRAPDTTASAELDSSYLRLEASWRSWVALLGIRNS